MNKYTVVYDVRMRAEVEAKTEAEAIEYVMSGEAQALEDEIVSSPEAYKQD